MATAMRGAIGFSPQVSEYTTNIPIAAAGNLGEAVWIKGHTISIAPVQIVAAGDPEVGDSYLSGFAFKGGRWVEGQLELTPRIADDLVWLLWGFAGTMNTTANATTGNVHRMPATGTGGAGGPDRLESDLWFTVRRIIPADSENDDIGEVFANCKIIGLQVSAVAGQPLRAVLTFRGLDLGTPIENPYNATPAWAPTYDSASAIPMSLEATLVDADGNPITNAQSMEISLMKNVTPAQRELVLGSERPKAITDNGHVIQVACTSFWNNATLMRKIFYGAADGTEWSKTPYTGSTNFSLMFKTTTGICGTDDTVQGEFGFAARRAVWQQEPVVVVPGQPLMYRQTGVVLSANDSNQEDWAMWVKNDVASYTWPVSTLVSDQFTTDRSAGSVHGTACEPGPNATRTVTDTESKISIASSQLTFSGGKTSPENNDPYFRLGSVTRRAGMTLLGSVNASSFGTQIFWGFDTGAASSTGNTIRMNTTGLVCRGKSAGNSGVTVGDPLSTSTTYQLAISLRASGAYFFIKGGTWTYWTLIWVDHSYTGQTLYPGIRNYNGTFVADNFRIYAPLWLPTPLAYDTFARSVVGSTETVGPDYQTCTPRPWQTITGTLGISNNTLLCTSPDGLSIGVYDTGVVDVLHGGALIRGTGTSGLIIRYADTSNYVYAVHNGTNARLIKRVDGTETTLINTAATFSSGARLIVLAAGTEFRLFYDSILVGTTQTINDAGLQTGTKQGVYFTGTDDAFDNILTYARGSNNEYTALDSM